MSICNALTIDVEDYYQVTNFEKEISRQDWARFPSRVVANTQRILSLLEAHDIKATFFVLGYVAKQHPDLVREIANAGHEIGSHSYWHRLVYTLSPAEFRDDLRLSRELLEDIAGLPVRSYRSPSFSITKQSLWALDILAEEGFAIDSSIFPIKHTRYGISDSKRVPHELDLPSGRLWEFPITVSRMANLWNIPVAGGGYFRLFPLKMTTALLRRVNDADAEPFIFYTHPWEFDPEQPRIRAGSRIQRFRHYVNLTTTARKFEQLLKTFRFGRLDEVLANYISISQPVVAAS